MDPRAKRRGRIKLVVESEQGNEAVVAILGPNEFTRTNA